MSVTLCAICFTPEYRNKAANTAALLSLCTGALEENPAPHIICLPELCTTGYIFRTRDEIAPLCESARGETFLQFSELCAKYGCYLAYGFAEIDGVDLFNSQNLIAPDGRLLETYRKVNLFELDTLWAQSGARYCYIDSPYGRIGLGICMDLNSDDFVDWHIANKSDMILFSTNWLDQGVDITEYWKERLEGYGAYFVAANRAGSEFGVPFIGTTLILKNASVLAGGSGKNDRTIKYSKP